MLCKAAAVFLVALLASPAPSVSGLARGAAPVLAGTTAVAARTWSAAASTLAGSTAVAGAAAPAVALAGLAAAVTLALTGAAAALTLVVALPPATAVARAATLTGTGGATRGAWAAGPAGGAAVTAWAAPALATRPGATVGRRVGRTRS